MKKEALRVTSTIPVAPTTLYFAWIDSAHHSSMTGQTAKIDPVVGAKYTACNGYVTGKLVILDLGRRIVESWRTADFPRDAADSRVEVHFETLGASTRILVLHTDIPEGQSEKYKALWNERYITPMRAYFSAFLPDPRNPPPRRIPPPPPEGDDDEDEDEDDVPVKAKGKVVAKAPVAPKSGPSVHKTEPKPVAAAKPAVAAKPAAAKPAIAAKPSAPDPMAAAKPAPAAKGKVAAKSAPAAKKPAAPAKKPAPAAKKPAPTKKPLPKKPAPPAEKAPAKGKKKR